jgi:hypothetical protein
VEKGQFEN